MLVLGGGIIGLEMDISYFGQLVTGFRTIMELSGLAYININQEHLELVQNLFPRSNSCFFEYF